MKKNSNRRITILILLILAQLMGYFLFYSRVNNYLYFDDSLELAQTARNLLSGKGFTLLTYTFQGLDKLKQTRFQTDGWPNLQKFPLPIFLLSGVFKIFGENDWAITFSSTLFYFLLLPVVFWLARRLNLDLKITIFSGLILIANSLVINSALLGQPEVAGVVYYCLFLGILLMKKEKRIDYFIGLIAALAYLNRFESIFWIVILLVWFFNERLGKGERKEYFKNILLIFILLCLPWWGYAFIKAGNPFFTLQGAIGIPSGTKTFPNALYAELKYVDPLKFVITHPEEIIWKFLTYARFFWQRFLIVGSISSHLFFFFLIWLLKKQNEFEESLKKPLILSFLSVVIPGFLFTPEPRYLLFFFPIIIILGVKTLLELIERFKKSHLFYWSMIFFFLFLNVKKVFKLPFEYLSQNYYRYDKEELKNIEDLFSENQTIISNLPRLTGWYSQRKSLFLPKSPDEIELIEKRYLEIEGIYLVSSRLHSLLPVWSSGWEKILLERPEKINNYHLETIFPSGSLVYKKNEKNN